MLTVVEHQRGHRDNWLLDGFLLWKMFSDMPWTQIPRIDLQVSTRCRRPECCVLLIVVVRAVLANP